ncbi:MAG: HEPN domain-containing protein [Chloroflexi bacterium]|nr:HEPN domain-containing protein [Chloroflexota bacterium]
MAENLHSEEIRLYLENARRDLEAARSNLELGYFHITVSRAYYAMFYAASALLASKDIYRSKHAGVVSAFGEYLVKPGLIEKEYGKAFGNAFSSRLVSDYDMITSVEKTGAEAILNNANRFVRRAEKYLGMATYED